ncbi:hypothetical protein L3X38_022796 [Prunus dulcis]|uniref:Uncharacterized protein n=1 Tax=Prunus dulcis TaxID=3755 RepID=A0AAD4VYL5_PRUDU|nr:hypothetical protein L3X38_022796 [Prunus dulcis]
MGSPDFPLLQTSSRSSVLHKAPSLIADGFRFVEGASLVCALLSSPGIQLSEAFTWATTQLSLHSMMTGTSSTPLANLLKTGIGSAENGWSITLRLLQVLVLFHPLSNIFFLQSSVTTVKTFFSKVYQYSPLGLIGSSEPRYKLGIVIGEEKKELKRFTTKKSRLNGGVPSPTIEISILYHHTSPPVCSNVPHLLDGRL